MKKCSDCNVEMLDASLFGHPRWMDMDHDITRFSVFVKTGNVVEKSFLGIKTKKEDVIQAEYKLRVCPKCGKVEGYIEPLTEK